MATLVPSGLATTCVGTITVRTDSGGERHYTGLWSNQGAPSELRPAYAGFELVKQPQWDVAVAPAALADLDFVVGQAFSLPSSVLQYRTLTLARLGRADQAKESLTKYLATDAAASFKLYVQIQVSACLAAFL